MQENNFSFLQGKHHERKKTQHLLQEKKSEILPRMKFYSLQNILNGHFTSFFPLGNVRKTVNFQKYPIPSKWYFNTEIYLTKIFPTNSSCSLCPEACFSRIFSGAKNRRIPGLWTKTLALFWLVQRRDQTKKKKTNKNHL